MKSVMSMLGIAVIALTLSGCANTVDTLKADGLKAVDFATDVAKKGIDAGSSVYSIVKSLIDAVKADVEATFGK